MTWGRKQIPGSFAKAARAYENSAVRRLGYLLERFGHNHQAKELRCLGRKGEVLQGS